MRKQLKNLCIFVVVLAFVLVGCTEKMLQEPTINQTEQAIAEQEQSLPLSSWRHGYLDKALTYEYTQFADASKRTVPALSTMSIASKLDLLESLQQEKGKRNTADDAFYEDLVHIQVGSVNVPIGNRTDGTYDYLSIMHYFPDAFAIDDTQPTITRKDGGLLVDNSIFSYGDTLTIRNLYK